MRRIAPTATWGILTAALALGAATIAAAPAHAEVARPTVPDAPASNCTALGIDPDLNCVGPSPDQATCDNSRTTHNPIETATNCRQGSSGWFYGWYPLPVEREPPPDARWYSQSLWQTKAECDAKQKAASWPDLLDKSTCFYWYAPQYENATGWSWDALVGSEAAKKHGLSQPGRASRH